MTTGFPPMSTLTMFDGPTYEIVDKKARERLSHLEPNGYTMLEMPAFTDDRCIFSGDSEYDIGTVGLGTGLSASEYILVKGCNTLRVMFPVFADSTPPAAGLVFYDSQYNPIDKYGTNCLWGRGENDPFGRIVEVFIPRNAKYFRTTWWSSDVLSRHPDTPDFTYTFTPGRYEDTAITSELPVNRGMMNAIRRARQLTDIRWTPRVNVPRYCSMSGSYATTNVHFLDWCSSGKEYQGIPYSGSGEGSSWIDYYDKLNPNSDAGKWGYYQFWVGLEVLPDTFVTASRYPNSIFGERANRSTVKYDASIYGNVCSSFIFYTLGLSGHVWPIYDFMSEESYGLHYFNEVGSLGTSIQPEDLRLGDVLHSSTHIAIITDIFRDSIGNVTAVEISEATPVGNPSGAANGENYGGMCRRKTWSRPELMDSYWARGYKVYRYKNFTAISYTPSDYVDTGREGNKMPIIDYPCIPYLGNKARYKAGHILNSKILIGAPGFSTLYVKSGSTTTSYPLASGQTEVSVDFSSPGSYEAYLADSSGKRTIACEWTVE